jgi:hypothetical protein
VYIFNHLPATGSIPYDVVRGMLYADVKSVLGGSLLVVMGIALMSGIWLFFKLRSYEAKAPKETTLEVVDTQTIPKNKLGLKEIQFSPNEPSIRPYGIEDYMVVSNLKIAKIDFQEKAADITVEYLSGGVAKSLIFQVRSVFFLGDGKGANVFGKSEFPL